MKIKYCLYKKVLYICHNKKQQAMTRLQLLKQRREKLIELNSINHYTQSGHVKIDKYYNLILSVKKQINDIECVNVRPAKASPYFAAKDLFNLNKN